MFELIDNLPQNAVIKVVGVGGGGGNALQHMVINNVEGVDFICANTDAQALKNMTARTVLQLGSAVTKGLGAGANPLIGREAAIEDRERIAEVLQGSDMVFITAGMGGGTGTGAAPIVAEVAREMGILTVLGKGATMLEAFGKANQVLQNAVQGIAELITRPGLINVDFADVRTVMSEMGMAMMGSASATGEGRAQEAALAAISSPLLEDINISGARGLLVNITAGLSMSIGEFEEVGNAIKEYAADDATVVIGTVIDPALTEELRVTVVATGLGQEKRKQPYKVIKTGTGTTDYEALDTPTVIRHRRLDRVGEPAAGGLEHLDIPAFLRKQAD